MDVDIKDIITLSDKHSYVVASKTSYQGSTYYYLVDKDSFENIKFCVENTKNSSLIEIDDPHLIQTLLPLFLQESSSAISQEELDLLQHYQDFNESN